MAIEVFWKILPSRMAARTSASGRPSLIARNTAKDSLRRPPLAVPRDEGSAQPGVGSPRHRRKPDDFVRRTPAPPSYKSPIQHNRSAGLWMNYSV